MAINKANDKTNEAGGNSLPAQATGAASSVVGDTSVRQRLIETSETPELEAELFRNYYGNELGCALTRAWGKDGGEPITDVVSKIIRYLTEFPLKSYRGRFTKPFRATLDLEEKIRQVDLLAQQMNGLVQLSTSEKPEKIFDSFWEIAEKLYTLFYGDNPEEPFKRSKAVNGIVLH